MYFQLSYRTNFLNNRSQRTKINDEKSNSVYPEHGVPQGTALSILLYTINMNSIGEKLTIKDDFSLFVDDLEGIIYGNCWEKSIKRINDQFDKLHEIVIKYYI